MTGRDLSYLARIGPERIAISFHVGLNLEPTRGAVLKLLFSDGRKELVYLPPGIIPVLLDVCRRFLADFRRNSPANKVADRMFRKRQPDISPEEFAAIPVDDTVVAIGALATMNGLVLEMEFRDGTRRGVGMAPAVVFHLRDYLERIAPLTPPIPGIDTPDPGQA